MDAIDQVVTTTELQQTSLWLVEEWKQIPGYEDYEASNAGRIRSIDRIDRAGRHVKGRILRAGPHRRGYVQVMVYSDKGGEMLLVHKLVALAYHGQPPTPKHNVNHKNGVKTDNRPPNLEWVTQLENIRHAIEVLGRRLGHPGESNGRANLTAAQVRKARSRYTGKRGEVKQLADELNVSYQALWKALSGKTWKTV